MKPGPMLWRSERRILGAVSDVGEWDAVVRNLIMTSSTYRSCAVMLVERATGCNGTAETPTPAAYFLSIGTMKYKLQDGKPGRRQDVRPMKTMTPATRAYGRVYFQNYARSLKRRRVLLAPSRTMEAASGPETETSLELRCYIRTPALYPRVCFVNFGV